jgi:hypothetical protein
MSHLVTIKTQVRDPAALTAACARLGLAAPTQGTAELYSGKASGLLVNLPGWRYPVVVDVQAAQVRYDNFDGAWGSQTELDRLLQAYAIEKARIEARKAGHAVTEQPLPDGSMKLTIHLGGAL